MRHRFMLFILSCLPACNDFLDVVPKGSLQEAELYTKEGAESLLIATYALLDGIVNSTVSSSSSGNSNWLWGSVIGGDANAGSSPQTDVLPLDILELAKFDTPVASLLVEDKWRSVYEGVTRANTVLRVVDHLTDTMNIDTLVISAQAHVLRGFFHFEAKKIWNMAPYIAEYDQSDVANNHADIWPQIEADLRYGYDHLPSRMPHIGQVNKWAAGSLLAKSLMFQRKFDQALNVLNSVYANGCTSSGQRYRLMAHYQDNFFSADSENNSESVFAFQYSVNDGALGSNGSFGEVLNYPAQGPVGCCGFFQPSIELVNSFRTDANGWPYLGGEYNHNDHAIKNDLGLQSSDPFNIDEGPIDPRLDWTVGRRGIPYLDWGLHEGKRWIRDQSWGGPYSPKKSSFANAVAATVSDAGSWTKGSSSVNYKAIRFADVILWLAECEAEIGSLDKARQYVNLIRLRAADPGSFVYLETGVPASNYVIAPYPEGGFPFDHRENAVRAVHFERKLELAMEGHRFFDLVRWNESATLQDYINFESQHIVNLKGATFQTNKDEFQPIPLSQIQLMGEKLLSQNPGY